MRAASERTVATLGLLILIFLYFGEISGYPLQDPDEGRYAEIPREMIESGDWITPRLNYVVYFEKPPLLYWLVAISFEIFGMNEMAARVVPAVSGVLVVIMTYFLGLHLLGRRAALLSAGVLATSPLFFALAQALAIDMLLTACTTATLGAVYGAYVSDKKTFWILGAVVSAALGVLAKGPVALLLPGLIALAFLLQRRDWSTIRAFLRPVPIALFLLVVVPWFVLVARANPIFLHYFFIHEHFERFAAEVGHPEGPWYYIPVLLVGPLPWTAVAIGLGFTREGRRSFGEVPTEAKWFLFLWSVLIILFFSAASSKLATYILPALPALALLLGGWLDRALERIDLASGLCRALVRCMLALGAIALLVTLVAWPLESTVAQWFGGRAQDVRVVAWATLRLGVVLVLAGYLIRRLFSGGTVTAVGALYGLILSVGLAVFASIAGRAVVNNSQEIAQAIQAEYRPGDVVVFHRRLWQGMPFYLGHRVDMSGHFGEISHGVDAELDAEEHYWKNLDRLPGLWNSDRRVFVLTRREQVPQVAAVLNEDPRLLAQHRKRVVVVNFPPGQDGGGGDGPSGKQEPGDSSGG